MSKLYSVITKSLLFLLLIGACGALKAQTLNNAIITVNATESWTQIHPGITACNSCTITISGNAVFTLNSTLAFGAQVQGSTIYVTNNSQLVIASNVSLANTQIIIGDASASNTDIAPGTASLAINKGATLTLLDNISAIRLANLNNQITAAAGNGTSRLSNDGAGQIVYTSGSTTVSLFSGNNNWNITNVNVGGVYSNPPPTVTGPAISSVTFKGGLTIASFGPAFTILPITLVNFSASLNSNGSVGLAWATDEEENSSYFSIQRSANGGAWTSIGKVAAQGNSSVTTNYSFTDPNPVSGTDDYRLQAVDLDGAATYSSVQVIRTSASQSAGFSIFPNPARDLVNVSLTSAVTDATIRLVDLNGKVLVEQKVTNAANTIVAIPVQSFVTGTYVLVVKSSDGTQYTGKVLIAH